VHFYSEFWQKSCKNIDIIFDSLDITLIDINVEINGDIIFQTSVYDPCIYTKMLSKIEFIGDFINTYKDVGLFFTATNK